MWFQLLEKIKLALHNPDCRYCGADLPETNQAKLGLLCQSCHNRLNLRDPHPLMKSVLNKHPVVTHAATLFNRHIKHELYGYKFYQKNQNIGLLTNVLCQYWHNLPTNTQNPLTPSSTIVCAIPPHANKPNLLAPLAKQFAARFNYQYIPGLLTWQRDVSPQHTLHNKRQRFDNVKNSLTLNPLLITSPPSNIIVVDDLTTTGATMLAAMQALSTTATTAGTKAKNPITLHGLALSYIPLAFRRLHPTAPTEGSSPATIR